MLWERYEIMTDLSSLLALLAENGGRARVVAGGTDLMVQLKESETFEEKLVLLDVSRIEEMCAIKEVGDCLQIGAAATMTQIAGSELVQAKARALAQGAEFLGSPQIRNAATIGGNVVTAQPAADTAVPLVALSAEAHIVSLNGSRDAPVEKLYLGVGKSAVNPVREVITHFRVPVCRAPLQASAMQRLAKRKAFTLPQLSAAVRVELEASGRRFRRAGIVAAPVAPRPWRAERAEEALSGAELSAEAIQRAAALAREDAQPRDSLRGGAEYRRDMVEVLVRRAIFDALAQLGQGVS